MKRKWKLAILLISVIILFGDLRYFSIVDTKYAIAYSTVFGTYEIEEVDAFLSDSTTITYQNQTSTYRELRQNVKNAFAEKRYIMLPGSSYGHGNIDYLFLIGKQDVSINSYLEYDNQNVACNIQMILQKTGPFMVRIKSLECDADFFGYLFFGIE